MFLSSDLCWEHRNELVAIELLYIVLSTKIFCIGGSDFVTAVLVVLDAVD